MHLIMSCGYLKRAAEKVSSEAGFCRKEHDPELSVSKSAEIGRL